MVDSEVATVKPEKELFDAVKTFSDLLEAVDELSNFASTHAIQLDDNLLAMKLEVRKALPARPAEETDARMELTRDAFAELIREAREANTVSGETTDINSDPGTNAVAADHGASSLKEIPKHELVKYFIAWAAHNASTLRRSAVSVRSQRLATNLKSIRFICTRQRTYSQSLL